MLAAPPALGEPEGVTVGLGVEPPPPGVPVGLSDRVKDVVGEALGEGEGVASTMPCTKMGEEKTVPALVLEFHTSVGKVPGEVPVRTPLNCSTP